MGDWSATEVFSTGVPDPPSELGDGDEAPVAVWTRGRLGAVLTISFDASDAEEPYSHDIVTFLQNGEGSWEWLSAGGSDWPYAYRQRPTGGQPMLTGFATCATVEPSGDCFFLVSGIAPIGVECVRVVQGHFDSVVDAERATGAFLAPVDDCTAWAEVTVAATPAENELRSSRSDLNDQSWRRIADDLHRTTGHVLEVRDLSRAGGWCEADVVIDGSILGGFGQGFSEPSEEFVAELADYLQEMFLHEEIWGGWPLCPQHLNHPLAAGLSGTGEATWFCSDGSAVATIGRLLVSG